VHPELVEIIPTYRSGAVVDHSRDDWGVDVRGNSFTRDGSAQVPVLPGMSEVDEHSYFGGTVFPNAFVDITGTSVIVSFLQPKAADRTTVVTEYLFAPSTVAADGFDPSDIVEFSELVAGQDYRVCEMVQRGVGSKHFTAGVLSPKDELVIAWKDRYRAALGQ
jgi:Rieske 2Fe-2S family protein